MRQQDLYPRTPRCVLLGSVHATGMDGRNYLSAMFTNVQMYSISITGSSDWAARQVPLGNDQLVRPRRNIIQHYIPQDIVQRALFFDVCRAQFSLAVSGVFFCS